MSYRLRVFVRTSSGEIRRLPRAKYERLLGHDAATIMPEFVGKEMPTAVVMLTMESGRVVDATLAETLKLKMNNKAQVSKRWHERLRRLSSEAVEAYMSERIGGTQRENEKVVFAKHRFLKRRLDKEFHWRPTEGEFSEMLRLALLR